MRAPARLIVITIVVFLAFTTLLSRSSTRNTVQQTISTRFAEVRQQWLAAKSISTTKSPTSLQETPLDKDVPYEGPDAHSGTLFSSGSGSSSNKDTTKGAAKNAPDNNEDTAASWGKNTGSGAPSDGRTPTEAERNRDADRGFTDKEQAQALERLEFKYGAEAQGEKDDSGRARLLWQLPTSTSEAWDQPTDIMDPEQAKAMEKLELEYETGQQAGRPKQNPAAAGEEVGWRTTGFNAKPTGPANATAKANQNQKGPAGGAFANANKHNPAKDSTLVTSTTSTNAADASRFLAQPTSSPASSTSSDVAPTGPKAAVSAPTGNRLPARDREAVSERRKRFMSKKWYMQCKELQDC